MSSIHNLPPTPAFLDERSDSPISEIALRVVVERPEWQLSVVGTATLICGHLAITARHVLDDAVQKYGANSSNNGSVIEDFELKLYQVLPGPEYRIWSVVTAWPCQTDIALLHLRLDQTTSPGESVAWRQPRLRALPPQVGEKVIAFGYRNSQIKVIRGKDGTHHIELNDCPTTSIGTVRHIYASGRDSVMLPFPCYEIEARLDAGMSGGMVIDEAGSLCGLICTGLQHNEADAPPISYVASLWPMLNTVISADRQGSYPKGISYRIIALALDGQINVSDLRELDPTDFFGKSSKVSARQTEGRHDSAS
jgi:hypothetical protein